jgi:hypothetical protein
MVSDLQNSPASEPDPMAGGTSGIPAEPVETDVTSDTVTVRRAPRYGRFILLGDRKSVG